jgi:hypothetical protein
MESSEKDIKARIGLAWGAFNKLRAILKAPNNASETFKKFKLRLFKASCLSILLYGCETWILTPQLIKKLEVYQRDSYRIMMDINQHRDHMTNVELYKLVDQLPLGEMIRIRQLTFVGHCLRMTDNEEPIKKFILYESKVKPTNRPYARKTYLDQISFYITHEKSTRANPTKLTVNEIEVHAKDRRNWKDKIIAEPKKPLKPKKPPAISKTPADAKKPKKRF